MIWDSGNPTLPRQAKLLRLGVPLELLARLRPGVAASPGAPQPGAAAKPSPSAFPPARNSSLSSLAPAFSVRLWLALKQYNDLYPTRPVGAYEGLRTSERQSYLYSLGRTRPGGIVTNAATVYNSWHGYGLALDVVPIILGNWSWPSTSSPIWSNWLDIAELHGLSTGLHWHFTDAPHTQPSFLNDYPVSSDQMALKSGGLGQIWQLKDQFSLSDRYIDSL